MNDRKLSTLEKVMIAACAASTLAVLAMAATPVNAETRATNAKAIIWAIDNRGNAFIAGSGDTCRDALRNVVWPKHMVHFACQLRKGEAE